MIVLLLLAILITLLGLWPVVPWVIGGLVACCVLTVVALTPIWLCQLLAAGVRRLWRAWRAARLQRQPQAEGLS